MNQKLEQYLKFFVDHRQKNQLKQLVLVEFAINNKTYLAAKLSLFRENYSRGLRMGIDIRRKEKIKKIIEFAERIKKVQKEAGTVLRKVQEEMK